MKQVTRQEFYDYVNPRDICVNCYHTSSDLSKCAWKTRGGMRVGETVTTYDYDVEESARITYYLSEDAHLVPEVKP